jgi:hypothetical protein
MWCYSKCWTMRWQEVWRQCLVQADSPRLGWTVHNLAWCDISVKQLDMWSRAARDAGIHPRSVGDALTRPVTTSYHILQDDLPSPVEQFSLASKTRNWLMSTNQHELSLLRVMQIMLVANRLLCLMESVTPAGGKPPKIKSSTFLRQNYWWWRFSRNQNCHW